MRIVGGLVLAVGVVAIILRCLSTSPEVVPEEKECLRKLRHAPIVSVSAFGAEGSRSKKALVTLHGSFKAVIKLIRPSVLPRQILHQNPALTEQYDRGEFGVFYQGFPEIVAYHVDRVLGFHLKPTTSGRVVTREELDIIDIGLARRVFEMESATSTVVSIQHFLPHVEHQWPTYEELNFLFGRNHSAKVSMERVKSISNQFVLDYLLDDHDRESRKNWMAQNGLPVAIDSGMAWKHGPLMHTSCLEDILCDPTEMWRARDSGKEVYRKFGPTTRTQVFSEGMAFWEYEQQDCPLLRTFSQSTFHRLYELRSLSETPLGEAVDHSLQTDPLYPVFQYGYWTEVATGKPVAFPAASFFAGLTQRVDRLIAYLEECDKVVLL